MIFHPRTAALVINASGRIVHRSPGFLLLLGGDLSEATTLAELVAAAARSSPGRVQGRLNLLQALALDDPRIDQDFTLLGDTGAQVINLRNVELPCDGGDNLRLVLFEEVTAQRATEEYRLKVMSIARHDLRNPLAAITMNASLLNRDTVGPDERRIKSANRILSSVNRMSRTIDELFDYTAAAFGAGIAIFPQEADLSLIAEDAVAESRAAHPARDIILTLSGDMHGSWDPGRLHQVLQRLLNDALLGGDHRGPVNVNCVGIPTAPAVTMRVRSEAAPVAPAVLPRLFPDHHQAGEIAGDSAAFGRLVVRKIIDAHRGHISATSIRPSGYEVTVHLPRLPTPAGGG